MLLYLDKHGQDNVDKYHFMVVPTCCPLFLLPAAILGYLSTSIVLLSLRDVCMIWFALLIIYHIIQRWMLIQRRKLAFGTSKQKRAEILASTSQRGR